MEMKRTLKKKGNVFCFSVCIIQRVRGNGGEKSQLAFRKTVTLHSKSSDTLTSWRRSWWNKKESEREKVWEAGIKERGVQLQVEQLLWCRWDFWYGALFLCFKLPASVSSGITNVPTLLMTRLCEILWSSSPAAKKETLFCTNTRPFRLHEYSNYTLLFLAAKKEGECHVLYCKWSFSPLKCFKVSSRDKHAYRLLVFLCEEFLLRCSLNTV